MKGYNTPPHMVLIALSSPQVCTCALTNRLKSYGRLALKTGPLLFGLSAMPCETQFHNSLIVDDEE
ncbi:hypothetical protein SAMN05216417_12920 [Nitrosospira multiformis]|uniref:Uncharacterized protein n=1 Tax=Nitrosospira multiformis TaxID=1231 RepID=A0A1I7IWJ5_9PROT|nr:hypothetical protein SAMN05216417_12920 [Nitrosospira multiformis]